MGKGGSRELKKKNEGRGAKRRGESPLIPGGTLRRRRKGHIYAAVLFQGFFSFAVVREKRGGRFWFLYVSRVITPDRSRPRKSATKRFPAKTPMMMKTVVWAYAQSSG